MKKVFLFGAAVGLAVALSGCAGTEPAPFDDADSAFLPEGEEMVEAPPVPPVPEPDATE